MYQILSESAEGCRRGKARWSS